jgi:HK97 gp10 family phage protein
MAGVTFTLRGAEDVSAKFRALSEGIRRKVAAPAAKDAMEILLTEAQHRAALVDDPKTPNYIPLNLAMVERKKLGEGIGAVVVSVGVRKRKKGMGGGNTFYWWWVELGTSKTRAQPFLRGSLEDNRQKIFNEFVSSARYQLIKLGEY